MLGLLVRGGVDRLKVPLDMVETSASPISPLLTATVVTVKAGGWRGRDLTDGQGQPLGAADHGVLLGLDGREIARADKARNPARWTVHNGDGWVGDVIPPTRVNRKGEVRPARNADKVTTEGWLFLAGADQPSAYVNNKTIVRYPEGDLVASLYVGEHRWWGTKSMWADWRLSFANEAPRELRILCFGWLHVAWRLQRAQDCEAV